jgi:hypothetical protein
VEAIYLLAFFAAVLPAPVLVAVVLLAVALLAAVFVTPGFFGLARFADGSFFCAGSFFGAALRTAGFSLSWSGGRLA